MVIFLTSSFIKYQAADSYVPHHLDESNYFGDNLRKYWVPNAHFLIFASDPSDINAPEHLTREMQDAFSLCGFSIGEMRYFDYQYIEHYSKQHHCDAAVAAQEALKDALQWADVFFLSGGHVPTENAFMKECNLINLINDANIFDGIFIGLSAGSMNAAREVYLAPEQEGESIDPSFVRFAEGLGFTNLNIVPHLEYEQAVILDGRKLIDEIVAEDSINRDIYLINDGSYFMIRNGITEFFGEGKIMRNGVTRPLRSGIINADNPSFFELCPDIFEATTSDYYEWALDLNKTDGTITFFHISDFMLESGIVPINIDTFDELNQIFANTLVVSDERQPYIDQLALPIILEEIAHKGCFVRTVHIDTADGIKAENIRIKPIANTTDHLLVYLTDITMILDRDWMTDEYSRSGFLAKTEHLLKDPEFNQGYSIVYANIKGFKAVNDLLGTQNGDMVIFLEKDALMTELNPILIARLEGDHFAVLTKTENITEEKMDKLCHQCYCEGTKRLQIIIQCGVYNIYDPTKKVSRMLDQAKLAEQSISTKQRIPYAICNERMSQDYVNQRIFISELDSALEKGEFIPFYQPIVDAMTGEIVCAEALIRWKHPEKGMIPPGMFIPVFEKEGVITKLDSFMINSVLNFNNERLKNGQKTVPCAVNLSRVDFYDTKLLGMLKTTFEKQENIQHMLKLEITESAYAVLESDALVFLEEMKKLGLTFQLDDFGSGMSSLSALEFYDFDTIKLDMGFIRKIGKSPKVETIIRHTIGMAHGMSAKVVAEGVEDKEQLAFLQSVGCDMIQGYYFYKPMPEEEFAALL